MLKNVLFFQVTGSQGKWLLGTEHFTIHTFKILVLFLELSSCFFLKSVATGHLDSQRYYKSYNYPE